MVKLLPDDAKDSLTKARESAILAIDTYNRAGTIFRSGAYIVLMVIAWTALFHAIFLRRNIKPQYQKKIDGEYKYWELSKCIAEYYEGNNPPVRKNLEFFIGLRNKIEHRSMPQLDNQIFGECQACLLNFEALLIEEFGEQYSLNESLAVSLQFSAITPLGKAKALRKLQTEAYQSVMEYVKRFRSSLSSDIFANMEYSYKVFLLPKTGNHHKSSDLAVEFINVEDLDQGSSEQYEKLVTLLKTREVAVRNPGQFKPKQVVSVVAERLEYKFTVSDHTVCWKHFEVRPPTNVDNPAKCNTKYCQYDVPHKDYIYTDEWVNFLVSKLSDAQKYQQILGKTP
jgi:hypothetical protein